MMEELLPLRLYPFTFRKMSIFFSFSAFTLPRVCGSDQPKFYDVDKNVCCNGTLYPLLARNGTRYGCCSRTGMCDISVLTLKDITSQTD